MKKNSLKIKKIILIITIISLATICSACTPWTIVKDGDINSASVDSTNTKFNADSYATKTWDDKVLKYFNEKAIQADILIKAIKENATNAGTKYGYKNLQSSGDLNFIIKGKGKLINVDKSSKNEMINLDLAPYDKNPDVKIQIGPVIKQTSIRDSLDFIKFDDFENQIEYATVSNSYNNLVIDKVLKGINFNNSVNKEIEFIGAFTFEKTGGIIITPVNIKVIEGGK